MFDFKECVIVAFVYMKYKVDANFANSANRTVYMCTHKQIVFLSLYRGKEAPEYVNEVTQ